MRLSVLSHAEYALKTRQFLVDQQMYNFRLRPTIGWGFQVSPEVGEMERQTGGLVLTAPVEKGTMQVFFL